MSQHAQPSIWPTLRVEVGGGPLSIGRGRWLFWQPSPELDVRVRVSEETNLPPVPVELVVRRSDGGRITGSVLRELPVGQLERALTAPSLWAAVYDERAEADFDPSVCTFEDARRLASLAKDEALPGRQSLALRIPPRGRRDDEFYEAVATLHEEVARTSHRPAALIAEANDVAVSTVHGWLKEFKRRSAQAAD